MNNAIREQNIEVLIQKGRAVCALQDKEWSTEQQYLGYVRRFLRYTFSRPKSDTSEKKFEDWLTQMVLMARRSTVTVLPMEAKRLEFKTA